MNENTLKIEIPSWWRRRPRTEKCLLLMVGVLAVLVIIVLFLLFLPDFFKRGCKYGSRDVCFTPDCVKTAAQVLEKVDLDVNPCDDFYKFACGNFIKNTLIPEDKQSVDSFTVVGDKVLEQMERLLKEPITTNDIKPFVLAKSLYQACMNTPEIETNSLPNFKRLIKNTGGWPLIDREWNENHFDWINTSYKFMKTGFPVNMFLEFKVQSDVSNSTRKALFLDQKKFTLDEVMREGFNNSMFKAYYEYMVYAAIVFGAEKQQAYKEMRDVANLISDIAKITVPKEQRRNSSVDSENNPMTIKELEEIFNYVPWLEYINTMLHPYKALSSEDIIIVKVPVYYEKLKNILTNTSKRTLANYMYWWIIDSQIDYLNDDLRSIELKFYQVIWGITRRPPRWKECTEQVIRLYVASGAMYVRHFFKKQSKENLVEIIDYIKRELITSIETVDWMDNTTRKNALNKIGSMYRRIAYPDELLADEKLENYYKNLTFNSSDYLGSMLNLTLFKNDVEFHSLDSFDKKDWRNHGYAAIVGAFYLNSENSIEFTAALLQDVFFDVRRPKYMNYGSIGHFIGHEMTHGFDDKGRQFDKNGNLIDWWQPKTKKAFIAKAQCIVDQYGNITVPEIGENLNGINTQGENIADNAGIKLAYLAYKKWSRKYGVEPVLPGLSYSPEQMFWISVANIWCSVERDESLKINVMSNVHAPNRYRVNVPLMNSDYFIKDFGCPLGSNMNPKHKCNVW